MQPSRRSCSARRRCGVRYPSDRPRLPPDTARANLAPFVLLGALWFIMIRQMQSGGNKALSFGKSKARLLSMQQKKVTFKDVAGVDEAKEELKEIIEFLREAQKFQKLRRPHSQGRAAGWASRNRQDFAGAGGGGRSQRSLLQHLGLRFRGDVRRRRCKPRPRPLRTGQEERALHHLHRRNRCRGGRAPTYQQVKLDFTPLDLIFMMPRWACVPNVRARSRHVLP